MKIVIFGSSGQLGKYLITDLSSSNFNLVCPTHSEIDITQPEKLNTFLRKIKSDYVINLVAEQRVDLCEQKPEIAFLINSTSVSNIAKITSDLKIGIMTISTDYVFNGKSSKGYSETDSVSPIQIYGASKANGETLSLEHNPKALVIRTSGLYGGKGSKVKGNFVLNRISDANTIKRLEVVSNQITSPTYAKDLSYAILKILEMEEIPSGILHLVNEGSCSWAEFTKEIYQLLNIPTEVIPVTRDWSNAEVKRPLNTVLKNIRAKQLGITLPSWKEALKDYIMKELI